MNTTQENNNTNQIGERYIINVTRLDDLKKLEEAITVVTNYMSFLAEQSNIQKDLLEFAKKLTVITNTDNHINNEQSGTENNQQVSEV